MTKVIIISVAIIIGVAAIAALFIPLAVYAEGCEKSRQQDLQDLKRREKRLQERRKALEERKKSLGGKEIKCPC